MLESIGSPRDLRALSYDELDALAQEIRDYLVVVRVRTGRPPGAQPRRRRTDPRPPPGLRFAADSLVFDTGHQAYVHKLLTGRRDFSPAAQARGSGGLPFACRVRARHRGELATRRRRCRGRRVSRARTPSRGARTAPPSPIIGDGALTGGMAWEALNSLADCE